MPTERTALIALDWGTSNLRAVRLDPHGQVLEQRSAPGGVMTVPAGGFAARLLALCEDWLQGPTPPALIASGMVGSRQGWQEAPYLPCPATLADAAQQLARVDFADAQGRMLRLHIAPGLRCVDARGQDDVMRGEETQMWGADWAAPALCVLPGTHSKWVWLEAGGAVRRFKTLMTGELYGVLTQHSILGRLMDLPAAGQDAAAFAQGVALGHAGHADLAHTLFAARTAGLMGRVSAQGLPDFLSGLLLGAEVGSTQAEAVGWPIHLLGDDGLCERYARALSLCGLQSQRVHDAATVRGQWRLALAAGLIKDA